MLAEAAFTAVWQRGTYAAVQAVARERANVLAALQWLLEAGEVELGLRLAVTLTGYWQVLGRTRIPFEEMVKLDYLYVMNWSLWSDVRLMLRTLPVVLGGDGAN